jgi:hypothetical protein
MAAPAEMDDLTLLEAEAPEEADVGGFVPVELGADPPPVDEGLVTGVLPVDGVEVPVPRQLSLPAVTGKGALLAVAPVLSLIDKRSWVFSVTLTAVHETWVPVCPSNSMTGVVPAGLVFTSIM